MSKTTIYERRNAMYQIKVNGVLMPTIYYTLREAMDACAAEKARGCAVVTEIVHL